MLKCNSKHWNHCIKNPVKYAAKFNIYLQSTQQHSLKLISFFVSDWEMPYIISLNTDVSSYM